MTTNNPPALRARRRRFGSAVIASLALSGVLGGCVAAVGGAMVGGSMLAVDRRTTGTQVDDQTIELRASTEVPRAIGERGNISVTSYNRVLLLTGEVPTEEDRAKAGAAAAKIENVRAVLNELAVMPNASINQITADSITTGKVKAAFIDTPELQVASMKVVTDRGTVFLMGRVTEGEAALATNVARSVGGVKKVVKVFEIITPAELAAMPLAPVDTPGSASAPKKK